MLVFAGVVMNEVQYVLYAPKMAENKWVSLGLSYKPYKWDGLITNVVLKTSIFQGVPVEQWKKHAILG